MAKLSRKKLAVEVWDRLNEAFPDSCCSLDSGPAWQLSIRGILSAQCTDKRVNITAGELFEIFKTPEQLDAAQTEEVEEIIRPCGLYKAKAASLKTFVNLLVNEWGGEVPKDRDELMRVPGIGRKIANLILGECYGIPAVVVDTHCKRVMYRIGITDSRTPAGVEKDILKYFPEDEWIKLGHLSVDLGRNYCRAGRPLCESCPLSGVCGRREVG